MSSHPYPLALLVNGASGPPGLSLSRRLRLQLPAAADRRGGEGQGAEAEDATSAVPS